MRESDRLHAKFELSAEADRLHAMLECAGETDLPNTVSESFLKLLEVRSVGLCALTEFNALRRVSSVVLVERLLVLILPVTPSSATRVESPSSRVQRVNAALLENSHSHTMFDKMITVLTRYRPNVLELV